MNSRQVKMDWGKYLEKVNACQPLLLEGRIVKVAGLVAEATGPGLSVGSLCAIQNPGREDIQAEVVGFKGKRIVVMPYGDLQGVMPGSRVIDLHQNPIAPVGEGYLGRVIDGFGRPLDGGPMIKPSAEHPLYGSVLNPLKRGMITEVLDVGVCSINAMMTVGKGQRVAIMSGSGVGKSVLMGIMARNTRADVSVVALIGERGREVREFVERSLGEEGLKKSVVVAATSDTPALVRIRGSYLATALAEYFRDKGLDVLFIMDSVTRFAMALREVGLAAGEPPSAKGYTPSVFARIPRILERAGKLERGGTITGIFNVLVEGDDLNEPIADCVRSITDGHIVLSRSLANRGHYPAVDVLGSISRLMKDIVDTKHLELARRLIRVLSTYKDAEDLINVGAYVEGSDPDIDFAKKMIGRIRSFLQQGIDHKITFEQSVSKLRALFES